MSSTDLLSSTLSWPGKGLYGLKSSVLQTTENNLVKQGIVSDHMRHHYRRLHNARSAVDSKPPKALILGQKCRDRARKEMVQMAYTQNILDQFSNENQQNTPRTRASQSARSRRIVQSQPTTFRARSRSIESSRMMTRSLTMNGSMQNLNQNNLNQNDIANKLFGDGVFSQALTAMAALGKMTSTARNKSSADVLDKHPDHFSQPKPTEHQPRLVKRDGPSILRNNRTYYNPPRKTKSQIPKQQINTQQEIIVDENKQKEDEQLALSIRRVREQLNKSLELRQTVEKKIKKAKATPMTNSIPRKQSDLVLKQFGLTERERLQYVRFMQEITDAIIRNNYTTESAIEKLFEIYIDRNRGKLNENRLRDLLEALKDDLGVQTSRKVDTYSSVNKATTYDNEPLPSQTPIATRKNSLISTSKTSYGDTRRPSYGATRRPSYGDTRRPSYGDTRRPSYGDTRRPSYDNTRRPSYDINALLPWESENDIDKQPIIMQRTSEKSQLNTLTQNPLDDDYLFSSSLTTIKPKPRLSVQTNIDNHDQLHDIPNTQTTESESTIPMNFNATIRKPMNDLHNVDWFTDSQPTKTTNQKSLPYDIEEHHIEEEEEEQQQQQEEEDVVDDHEQQSPSPELRNHPELSTYDSNDFEENDNEIDNFEQ
ncbi:unnamed protein product [Rotaria sordida]|uniref:Spermatogenesis-associated protein 7 homolog n=1 Tax=Rotaria sordida TaxID=392033 RepID=A0A815L519_9BILA|nr:unnamed protein product [Rotaria sordida]